MEHDVSRNISPPGKNVRDGSIAAAIAVALTLALRKSVYGQDVRISSGESRWIESSRLNKSAWDMQRGWSPTARGWSRGKS